MTQTALKPTADETTKAILRSQILVDPKHNYRHFLPRLKDMAASLKTHGQLQDIVVSPLDAPGPNGEIYLLRIGSRRIGGWDLLKLGDEKPIMAKVKKFDAPAEARIANIHSNEHEKPHPYESGAEAARLIEGDYEDGVPIARKDLFAQLGWSASQGQKLLTMHYDTHEDVKAAVFDYEREVEKKKYETDGLGIKGQAGGFAIPIRFLVALSMIKGKGKTEETIQATRREQQMAALDAWIAEHKWLDGEGKKRKSNGANGTTGGSDEPEAPAPIKPTKKIDKKGRDAGTYLRALQFKLTAGKPTKAEAEKLEGAIAVTRFFTGEVKTFPKDLLAEADFEALEASETPEETEEEETEEGGEE